MRVRTLIVIVVLLLVAAFVAVNWAAFTTPASLNLLVTRIEAPPALITLAILALAVLGGAIYMALWQTEILRESRRHSKELQAQRQLAEQAEASRFTELRAAIVDETGRLAERVTAADESMRRELRDQANSLAAMIGELDDRRSTHPVEARSGKLGGPAAAP